MPRITTKDGTQIYYKDWGNGQPIVFSHGWPLSADAWEDQMIFLAAHGYRCIAHDRRGHGRSDQTWEGNNLDTYADDLAELTAVLDLRDAIHVGHSTGGGEVARYIGRHGTKRVAKAVLIGAIPPLMLKTPSNPAACRSRYSISFAPTYSPIARSSARISAPLSTAPIGRELKSRRVCGTPFGCKGCWLGTRLLMIASRHSLRRI
jgi:pimeloyl-ACP methyl ester carboxylesterase